MIRVVVRALILIVVGLLLYLLGNAVYRKVAEIRAMGAAKPPASRGAEAAPVEVAAVERGAIELRRIFSGTLEARARFEVAPKVGGRVVQLAVDLADAVQRGQVVAELDNDEYQHALAQAEASLAVERANLAEAHASVVIAQRGLERVKSLQARGVSTESEYDAAEAERLAKSAAVEVADAQVKRAAAAVAASRTRLGYTRVTADWNGGSDTRWVAQRFVDVGDTVGANTPLLLIVELDSIEAVVHVTEGDYGRLQPGQAATLTTDAFPGEIFAARIARIAPAFRTSSRQARVELAVENRELRLKPGMFVRTEVILARVEDATIVPAAALVERGGKTGVFCVGATGEDVRWRPVACGIRQDGRVEVIGDGVTGRVVTLGHQLVEDGSRIVVPEIPRADGMPAE